jgi:HK97 family phage prohead protease/HK97 family phage major capsid protein
MRVKLPGQGEVLRLTNENAFTRETVDGDVFLEGWATTEKLNAFNQIVKATAFRWKGGLKRFNGRVLAFHDQRTAPVGKVEQLKIVPGKGLWVRVRVFEEAGPLFLRNLEEGMLNAFSIGFQVNKYEYDEKKDIITFIECELIEISIVNVGANEEAVFAVTNALLEALPKKKNDFADYTLRVRHSDTGQVEAFWMSGDDAAGEGHDSITAGPAVCSVTYQYKQGSNSMADDKDKVIDPALITLDMFEKEKQELTDNVESLRKMQHDLQQDVEALRSNSMSKTDFLQKVSRMQEDFDKLAHDIEAARNAIRHEQEEVFIFEDYRSMLNSYEWLRHEDGRPYSDIDYRAHALFQMPINYEKFDRGQELKNLRTLHDAVKIIDAQKRFMAMSGGGGRYRLEDQKIWKQFTDAVNRFDTVLAHAMAAGNTGYGAEWVPEEMSAEFNAYLRLQPTLSNKFRTWNMPVGSSAKYPFQNGRAVVYAGTENLVDAGAQARKTNIATGAKTFTPVLFIGALVTSEILSEDSILNLVALIRSELMMAMSEKLDSVIINGDTNATHQDNVDGGAGTYWQTYDLETKILGLRAKAADDSKTVNIETLAGTTGVGSLCWENFLDIKSMMGIISARNPDECLWITGPRGRTAMQNALHSEDALGVLPFLISGTLPRVDGSEVHISGQYLEDLDSDGLGHATPGSGGHTSLLCVHKPSFMIGQRRGITLQVAQDILTQQQQFVSTGRWDFGSIAADDFYPVACGINIQHT